MLRVEIKKSIKLMDYKELVKFCEESSRFDVLTDEQKKSL